MEINRAGILVDVLTAEEAVKLYGVLDRKFQDAQLFYRNGLLPISADPITLPKTMLPEIHQVCRVFFKMVSQLTRIRVESNQLDQLMPLPEDMMKHFKQQKTVVAEQVVMRLDVVLDPVKKSFKVIEVNCGDPTGMGWNDVLFDVLVGSGLGSRLDGVAKISGALPDTLLSVLNSDGETVKQLPKVFFVCGSSNSISSDLFGLSQQLKARGVMTQFADPSEFVVNDDKLFWNGERVRLIYRDMIEEYFGGGKIPGADNVLLADIKGTVAIVNPFLASAADFKMVVAILSDDIFGSQFDADEVATIKRFCATTCPLTENNIQTVVANKDKFVLKPNVGFGGDRVFVGVATAQSEWDKICQNSVMNDFVVQDYVPVPRTRCTNFNQNEHTLTALDGGVNVSFWVHSGQFVGAYARVSNESVINISQSGLLSLVAWK
jgi:hypothetical protein